MPDRKTGVGKVRSTLTAASKHITDVACDVLRKNSEGLRYSDLIDQVTAALPQYSYQTVSSVILKLTELTNGEVIKPSRGLYCLQAKSADGAASAGHAEAKVRLGPFRPKRRIGAVNRIRTAAIEILKLNPDGLVHGELVAQLAGKVADAASSSILRVVSSLPRLNPAEVERAGPGLYRYRPGSTPASEVLPAAKVRTTKTSETEFYASFADWLKHETEECSRALPLGGCKFGGKWGTPDVIGILEKKSTDPVGFPTEVVSAEIKLDDRELITAFGQACAYRLFSHKSYLVVPKRSQKADVDKLDSLCMVLGVGLVLFDSTNPEKPNFEIRVRPVMHAPDMYYANHYLKQVEGLW